MDLAGWLKVCPIVAILRGVRPEEAESIANALENSGVVIVEVPLNSPSALDSIAILSRVFGSRMLVGAGTVTTTAQVAEIAGAGGQIIVTPHADTSIVRAAKAAGLIAAPGFFNPTEAFALIEAGADALKLFPSEVLGIPMMKALRAVLPATAGIIPVGGLSEKNIAEWMLAGAVGVGVGTSIYRPGDTAETVATKAKALVAALPSRAGATV